MEFLLKQDSVMEKAHSVYTSFSEDRQLRELNEARQKRLKDEATRMASARREGKLEGTLETARQFKRLGTDADTISRATGLSLKEIEKL